MTSRWFTLPAITALLLLPAATAFSQGVTLDTPTVTYVGSSRASVLVRVQAGPSGAPGGFNIDCMRLADFSSSGSWPTDGSPGAAVQAAFFGQPTLITSTTTTDFMLGPNESIVVEVGNLFDETGVVSNDYSELDEATPYVVQAKAAGTTDAAESIYSVPAQGTTLSPTSNNCTYTQGFWKNHPPNWPVTALILGTVQYPESQLLRIFGQPAQGNGLVSLAHQLIAARLNEIQGAAVPPDVASAMAQADLLIGSKVVPPVGNGYLPPSQTSTLTAALDGFNTGKTGPGHCEDVVPVEMTTWSGLKALYR